MKCKKCGYELQEGAKFCPQCGEKVKDGIYCSECGAKLNEEAKFCSVCGKAIVLSNERGDEAEKIETVATKVKEINNNIDLSSGVNKQTIPRTKDSFILELEQLESNDADSKRVLVYYGKKIFIKYICPYLENDEKIIQIRHIVHFNFATFFVRHGAWLTKEFMLLTDRRVIKFAKTAWLKPRITSCSLPQIIDIETSAPKNWFYANFIGEKLYIKNNDKTLKIRTMGKGSSQSISSEIYRLKSEGIKAYANLGGTTGYIPPQATVGSIPNPEKKKKPWKFVGIAAAAIAVVIAAACVLGSGVGNGGTELYDILPLAEKDVVKYMSRNGMKDHDDVGMYSKDGITIMLNERGNIDTIVLDEPGYTLCDVEVGSKFEYERDFRKLSDHGYSFITEDEETGMLAVGLPNGKEGLGGDQVILIQSDSNHVVQNIMFQRTGAKELIEEIEKANSFIFPDSDSRYLTEDEVIELTEEERVLAIAEILARHGVIFSGFDGTEEIQEYFQSKSWYVPLIDIDDFDRSLLNEYELTNGDLLDGYLESESAAESGEEKALSGKYELNDGSNYHMELEIEYLSGDDTYYARFGGSYQDSAGFTDGFLDAYTDGTDNIWYYYDSELFDSGNYSPSICITYDGYDTINVDSLDGKTFGGMIFPGFSGVYYRTEEYRMP